MKPQSKSIFISNLLIVVILFSTTTSITAQEVEDEREFDYVEGSKKGVEYWGELKEEWSTCKNESMQSPIDISILEVGIIPTLLNLKRNYQPGNATVKNRGHDICDLEMESSNKMEQYMQSHSPIIPQSYPWLLIRDGKHLERQKIFNISKDKYYSITIPEMHNKMICTSTNEWLLLNDLDSKDLSLLNLLSMEVVQLPRLESFTGSDVCILSPPTSESNQDCYVMIIHRSPCRFYFCQPGDEEFSEQEFEFDLEEQEYEFGAMCISAATMFRGKVYFLTSFSRIDLVSVSVLFTAEFVGSNLHFTRITREGFPEPSPPEIPTTNDYLIESGGELLYICKMRGGWDAKMILGFIILRMNFLRQAWEEVNNIGGWTLFLSHDRGLEHKAISCFAAEGVKQNSIYFTKPFDRFYYVFDLENNNISKSLPCPIVSKFMSRLDWVLIPKKKS